MRASACLSAAGVYVHIPFCLKKCAYCDFPSYPLRAQYDLDRYFSALIAEIKNYPGRHSAQTVYFGGGTPALARPEQITAVLACLSRNFEMQPQAEVSLEANPGTINPAVLHKLKGAGVNRLSLGIQSTRDAALSILGRSHKAEHGRKTLLWARQAGFGNISCDLMYGLPNQSLTDFQRDLQELIQWAPEHVSLYALSLEPDTPLAKMIAQGAYPQPDDDQTADMYAWATDFLRQEGYLQYELSNFSKPGFHCRHNLIYWKNKEYIGFGAAAHSYKQGTRSWNIKDPESYIAGIAREKKAQAGSEKLAGREKVAEHLMLGLRLTAGIKRREMQGFFGKDWEKPFLRHFEKLQKAGLLIHDSQTIRISRPGMFLSNQVFRQIV